MVIPAIAKAAEVANEIAVSVKEADLASVITDAKSVVNEVWPETNEISSSVQMESSAESLADEAWDTTVAERLKQELDNVLHKYFDDIKEKSDVKDTLENTPFDVTELRSLSPEANALLREEFAFKKNDLKRQWEQTYKKPWPKYKTDIYITNSSGKPVMIRKAGMDYDAHHIQPLSLGGKNEASNITPLSADVHFDHKGIHQLGSPYDQISKMLGGSEL